MDKPKSPANFRHQILFHSCIEAARLELEKSNPNMARLERRKATFKRAKELYKAIRAEVKKVKQEYTTNPEAAPHAR
jgi:hypothetical protein